MAARAWRGAVEFGGFPVHLALHAQKKSTRAASFRNLVDGQPIVSKKFDWQGNELDDSVEIQKGVSLGRGQFGIVSDEAIDAINAGEETRVIEPAGFAPIASVPIHQALQSYTVTPDEKVAGSDRALNIVWNGLAFSGLAFIAKVTLRGGAHDSMFAMWADDGGLWAVTLPFVEELYPLGVTQPAHAFTVDEAQADMFRKVVEAKYEVGDYIPTAYTSDYRERREAAIASALAGETIEVPATPAAPAAAAPDLMAMLEASLADSKPAKKAPAKPKGKVSA